MADLFIVDVSEWQHNCDWSAYVAGGFLAAIARVCHGTTVDKIMPGRRDAMRKSGLRSIGWYLFLNSFQDVAAQVATFTSIIPTLGSGEYVIVDWEDDDKGILPTVAQREQALALLDQYYKLPVGSTFLYSYLNLLQSNPAQAGRKVWIAAYGAGEPSMAHVFWQYTNGQYTSGPYQPITYPGVGKGDGSVYHGTIDQFIAVTTNPAPPPKPPPLVQAKEPAMMQFTTDSSGAFHAAVVANTGDVFHYWSPVSWNDILQQDANSGAENLGQPGPGVAQIIGHWFDTTGVQVIVVHGKDNKPWSNHRDAGSKTWSGWWGSTIMLAAPASGPAGPAGPAYVDKWIHDEFAAIKTAITG